MEQVKLATRQKKQEPLAKPKRKEQFEQQKFEQQANFEQGFESMLMKLTPEQIWQVGYEILAKRPVFERLKFTRDYVSSLKEGGINISAFFILLGITAADVGELTPSDFGMILRYFSLNNKEAFELSIRALMHHPDIVRSVIVHLNKKQNSQ